MEQTAKPCPCGCKKWIVSPLFHCQEASLHKDEAEDLVRRWNAFEKGHLLRLTEQEACALFKLWSEMENGFGCDIPDDKLFYSIFDKLKLLHGEIHGPG